MDTVLLKILFLIDSTRGEDEIDSAGDEDVIGYVECCERIQHGRGSSR